MNLPAEPGIYEIRCTITGKSYLGRSHDMLHRCLGHLRELRAGNHESTYLQNAWNKYGEQAFEFLVDTPCPKQDTVSVEVERIKARGTIAPGGFNLREEDGTGSAETHPDTKIRLSVNSRNNPASCAVGAAVSLPKAHAAVRERSGMTVAERARAKGFGDNVVAFKKYRKARGQLKRARLNGDKAGMIAANLKSRFIVEEVGDPELVKKLITRQK